MSRSLGELRRGDEIGEVQQQRLDVCTVFTPTSRATPSRVKTPNESTTYEEYSSRCCLTSVDWSGWGPLLYPLYQRLCGVVVARARDHLAIARLDEAQAAWLGLPAHAPGLRVQREAFSLAGQCIEARTTWGDAFAFEYTAELR